MTQETRASRYGLLAAACALAFALYAAGVPADPPGFYIDESSVAYNAHTVSQTGRDEYGTAWPLYFRAFGDYKNPTFVYMLAAVFRLTGPSVVAARLLSASLGALAALMLGLLAARMTRRAEAAAVVAFSALLTPWLYEGSRLAFEVSVYPLAVSLFLLALWRASSKERWGRADVLSLAAALALLTYSYSTGRLLAPLLAAGLAFFLTRRNLARVFETWAAYSLTLVPLLVFNRRNPGALTSRFKLLTYVTPQSSLADDARRFALHYLADLNPWRWLVTGEWNVRDHVSGAGALLAPTVLLAACGLVLVIRHHARAAWWRFVLYALAASVVPAALTSGDFPQLRLIAFPVFLHVLTTPAVAWLLDRDGRSRARDSASDSDSDLVSDSDPDCVSDSDSDSAVPRAFAHSSTETRRAHKAKPRARPFRVNRRGVLYAVVVLMLAQGAYFQWLFHSTAQQRWYVFDARFPSKILAPALASNRSTVYLYDPPGRSGYIQALWHGALRGADASRFVRLAPDDAPPPGALVISTEGDCARCRLLARSINYILYAVPPTDLETTPLPLPPAGMRAGLTSSEIPATLDAGQKKSLNVVVRNLGGATWPAVGDGEGRYAVRLRDRWLNSDGSALKDEDGAAELPYDLEPGDTAGVTLNVNAPATPGEYIFELDLAQEGASWFGARGSKTLRAGVKVVSPGR